MNNHIYLTANHTSIGNPKLSNRYRYGMFIKPHIMKVYDEEEIRLKLVLPQEPLLYKELHKKTTWWIPVKKKFYLDMS